MLSPRLPTRWWGELGVAGASGAAAVWATALLQLHGRPYLVPMLAVLMMALRGGTAAGMLCGLSALALTHYHIIPPDPPQTGPRLDTYGGAAFAVTTIIISMLAGRVRETQLTLEATLTSIGDGVIVADEEGRVRYLNPVAEALTGWSHAEALGQPVDRVFNLVDERARTAVIAPIERALREGSVISLRHGVLLARNGSEHPIADSAAPIRDRNGRIAGAALVFSDASDQKQVEQTLMRQAAERQALLERERGARAEAERANRLKDEFLTTLSHELRTPLNAILGWSQILTRRQLAGAQQQQALAAIHRNALAQARLVDEVLDLSRLVTGRMALQADTIDLSDVVRTTAESFTPALLSKRQDLRLDLAPGAWMTGDGRRLRQVVWNLLSNATKFTPEGGRVSCRVALVEGAVELAVSDTGQGIDPGFLPYVFDAFRQADGSSTRRHGGLGLGLTLVRHLVEAHGGTIAAASAGAGEGTTVAVRFRARAPAEADARSRQAPVDHCCRSTPGRTTAPTPGMGL